MSVQCQMVFITLINMKTIKYPLQDKQWIATDVTKTHIVWHATGMRTNITMTSGANPITSMIDNWNHDGERVAVPYIIGRNGDVYETFPDSQWAYHVSHVKANGFNDKRSIGISLSNELGLIKGTDGSYYAFTNQHHQNIYQGPVFECKYRTFEYWADFDEAQIDTLINLTLELCAKYNIEPRMYATKNFDRAVWNKTNILRHVNCDETAFDFPMSPMFIEKIKNSGIILWQSPF